MKYKTENEFCIETTKSLLGLCVDDNSRFLCVPEVPKGFGANCHTDMLIINMSSKAMFAIEYKLTDIRGLHKQVRGEQPVSTIGIINRQVLDETNNMKIYGYTGKDYEVERLMPKLLLQKSFWTSIYESPWARFYYYAFKNEENDFNGGLKNSGRETLYHFYMQAIQNLQAENDNKLDFMIVNSVFDIGYSPSTARKYYRKVMKKIKEEKK